MEVTDRIASLEQRVQMQEDEIQLLKSALADVVRRLNLSEEQQAMGSRRGPTKVTVQIYLSRPAKQTGTGNSPAASAVKAHSAANPQQILESSKASMARKGGATKGPPVRKTPSFSIQLRKSGSLPYSPLDTPSYCSPIKSPSQYFQIFYHSKKKNHYITPSFSNLVPWDTFILFTLVIHNTFHYALMLQFICFLQKKCDSINTDMILLYVFLPVYHLIDLLFCFFLEEGYVKMFLKGRPITMYMPKDQVDTYCLEARAELPNNKLKLDWVYGYRGRDCRSNLYLLPTGETVYFIASVVVLFNVDEQLQRHYTGHTDDIKCLAVHPDKITIATGQVAGTSSDGKQLAPHVRVWDSVSLNTLHVLGAGFFDRALVCLAFSKSNGGNTLCAVDDSNDHVLSVWDWQREDRLAEVKCSNESVFAVDFHPTDSNIVVTCGKSHLYFWNLEKGILVKKQGLFEKQEKPKFVLCVTFAENGDTITGDSSGNILVWGKGTQRSSQKVTSTNRISHVIQGAHEGSIFALCMLRNGTLVSGGKDRRLISWDNSYQQIQSLEVPELFGPIRTIAEGRGETVLIGTTKNFVLQGSLDGEFTPITQGHIDELWGLAVHPWKSQFLTCGYDRQVSLWDSSSHQLIWAKSMEVRWLVLDTDSKDLVTVHTDGNEQLSVMHYGPDGNFLAIGSHDNYIYIYAVTENGRKYSRVGKCSGHSSFITHLDWSVDSQYLVSNSGDYEILYWIPSVCKQVVSVETTRDIEWATCTCTLGFQVFGLWPDGSDGTDINAVCRSSDKSLLVTGDDFGKVHLFSYPCSQFRAPSHVYGGHSSHVTNVTFLFDDSYLVSTGGKDMSVMQWRIV
uniref:EMAP like 1 n=1 Tax=Mastacembelus armatus TaxID=205130 RepID=A0A3Q3KMA9_9TELE